MPPRRLIETAFPLKQVSLDSVHEKNVRHGHISTLHIWPARRPLAASRAALLATLLPDPGEAGARRELLRRMAGDVIDKTDRDGEKIGETTRGGVLHWGRESVGEAGRDEGQPAQAGGGEEWNGERAEGGRFHSLLAFRREIKEAFGGRAPRVLDPFAGGGAIPLEAMRLGCEVVASDLNPVAWFTLRCALHYPHSLAGQHRPLPDFALRDAAFMAAFFKAQGVTRERELREALAAVAPSADASLRPWHREHLPHGAGQADFAWHLRAWGKDALGQARRRLAAAIPPTRSSSRCRRPSATRRRTRSGATNRVRQCC